MLGEDFEFCKEDAVQWPGIDGDSACDVCDMGSSLYGRSVSIWFVASSKGYSDRNKISERSIMHSRTTPVQLLRVGMQSTCIHELG